MRTFLTSLAVLAACCATSDAFSLPGVSLRTGGIAKLGASSCRRRPSSSATCMSMAEGKDAETISRRSVIVALSALVLAPTFSPAMAEGENGDEVVVQGELRFEEGTDKKFAKVGGKGSVAVTLRCVGKGIISETKVSVEAFQFPPPGKPAKGQEVGGGVPFIVKLKDLKDKTEKGRIINRDLWGDDDIFVRADLLDDKGRKVASGLGKAKYLFDTKTHASSFVLLE